MSKPLFLYFHRCLDTPSKRQISKSWTLPNIEITERRKSAGQICSLFNHFRFFFGIGTLEDILPVPCSVWRMGYVHAHVRVKCPCLCSWSYPCPSPCSCPCVHFAMLFLTDNFHDMDKDIVIDMHIDTDTDADINYSRTTGYLYR